MFLDVDFVPLNINVVPCDTTIVPHDMVVTLHDTTIVLHDMVVTLHDTTHVSSTYLLPFNVVVALPFETIVFPLVLD